MQKKSQKCRFTNNKNTIRLLCIPLANHMLEMSVKLKFECIRFEKKNCFALVVLNWVEAWSHDATYIIRFFELLCCNQRNDL